MMYGQSFSKHQIIRMKSKKSLTQSHFAAERTKMAETENRFERIYKQGGMLNASVQIFVDKKTGVNYMYVHDGYAGGLTVLLDSEGKPVITK